MRKQALLLQALNRLRGLRTISLTLEIPVDQHLPPQQLPSPPKGMLAGITRSLFTKQYGRLWLGQIQRTQDSLMLNAIAKLSDLAQRFQKAQALYMTSTIALLNEAQGVRLKLERPEHIENEIRSEFQTKRKAIEKEHYLRTKLIRNASIASIGDSRKATLASNGIVTAADISSVRISRIYGFGPLLTIELTGWRHQVETYFERQVFNPTAHLSPELQRSIKADFDRTLNTLIAKANQITGRVEALASELRSTHESFATQARELCQIRDQAASDLRHITHTLAQL